MNKLMPQLLAIGILFAANPASSRAEAPIRVLAYGQHEGNAIVYHYTVINNSNERVNNVVIGSRYNSQKDDTFPELRKLPVGWRYGEETELGREIILDPSSTAQPTGWVPSVYGQQDIYFFYLRWESQTNAIAPGQTLSGFSVRIPKGDDQNLRLMPPDLERKYLTGHFTVGLGSKSQFQKIHGPIEKLDTTPPHISVSVAPSTIWPPNGKLMPVNVTMSVKDDYDPAPEVKLESVTANEPLAEGDIAEAALGSDDRQFKLAAKRDGGNKTGRIYTITYSATDATGNKATASTTVTVPHEGQSAR